jgi:hypothetical protein
MSDKVFAGDYTDIKFIKSRKVAQVFIEIPLERANDFIAAFGTPNPATGVPVALARVMPEAAKQVAEKPKKDWNSLSPAQQAGIRCADSQFIFFLAERLAAVEVETPDQAAAWVRNWCGVKSRSEIVAGSQAAKCWKQIDDQFVLWTRYGSEAA